MLCNFSNYYVMCSLFTQNNLFKKSFRNNIRVSIGLDPDLDRRSVGPDLSQNRLQRLPADRQIRRQQGKI